MRRSGVLLVFALVHSIAFGAMDFESDNSDIAKISTFDLTGPPFTVCARVKIESLTEYDSVLAFSSGGSTTEYTWLHTRGPDASVDPLGFASVHGGTQGAALSPTNLTTGTWTLVCGREIATSNRAATINAGSRGINSTDVAPSTLNRTAVGGFAEFGASDCCFFDGVIAEVGIWGVELLDDEIATLSKGFAPPCVRRHALVSYYPMVRDASSLKDLFGALPNNLTISGAPSAADHPPVIRCQ